MLKNLNSSTENNIYKPIIWGVVTGLISIFVVMILMAFVLTKSDFGESVSLTLATIAIAIGTFLGGFVSARLFKRRGLFIGLITGLLTFIILVIIALSTTDTAISSLFLIRLAVVAASSSLGGIFGVNSVNKRKIV
ncbi:MAG: TIGR04086 family membrane protein [Oscillospiraceae bacterium]|nr:TIGR04086 family membrane protein [Oscillospiraceae bacterium]